MRRTAGGGGDRRPGGREAPRPFARPFAGAAVRVATRLFATLVRLFGAVGRVETPGRPPRADCGAAAVVRDLDERATDCFADCFSACFGTARFTAEGAVSLEETGAFARGWLTRARVEVETCAGAGLPVGLLPRTAGAVFDRLSVGCTTGFPASATVAGRFDLARVGVAAGPASVALRTFGDACRAADFATSCGVSAATRRADVLTDAGDATGPVGTVVAAPRAAVLPLASGLGGEATARGTTGALGARSTSAGPARRTREACAGAIEGSAVELPRPVAVAAGMALELDTAPSAGGRVVGAGTGSRAARSSETAVRPRTASRATRSAPVPTCSTTCSGRGDGGVAISGLCFETATRAPASGSAVRTVVARTRRITESGRQCNGGAAWSRDAAIIPKPFRRKGLRTSIGTGCGVRRAVPTEASVWRATCTRRSADHQPRG
jgi:hypothetical protein